MKKKPAKKPATIPVRVRFGKPRIYVGPGLRGKYYGKSVWDIWPTLSDANHPTLGGDGLFVEPATITVRRDRRSDYGSVGVVVTVTGPTFQAAAEMLSKQLKAQD